MQLRKVMDALYTVTKMGKDAPGAAGPWFDPRDLRKLREGVNMTNSGDEADLAVFACSTSPSRAWTRAARRTLLSIRQSPLAYATAANSGIRTIPA